MSGKANTMVDWTPSDAGNITLKMLQDAFASLPKKPDQMIPNPCDVTPEVYEALKTRCVVNADSGMPLNWILGSLDIHQRTDVPNWRFNPCTCHLVSIAPTKL